MLGTLISISLGTWGMTWLLVKSSGPGDIFGKLRDFMGVKWTPEGQRYAKRWTGELFMCEVCLSVWISVPVTLLSLLNPWLGYPLAAVGFVVLLKEWL